MSKLYRKSVEVRLAGDKIAAFFWRGKGLQVVSIKKVIRKRDWWEPDPGEVFRIQARGGGVYELAKDGKGWVLERVWD